jgi:hypothetical protein
VRRPQPSVRVFARLGIVAVVSTVCALIAVQYARIIERNVWYAHAVSSVDRDVATLEHKRDEQRREILRLSDPHGAIPEIHDRLHLVSGHEGIIYLKRHD